MRRIYFAVGALALVAVLAIAGCGGGGSTSAPSTAGGDETTGTTTESGGTTTTETGGAGAYGAPEVEEETVTASATKPAVVKVMNTPKLGKVIVDAEGMTMYDFHKDKGTTSSCYGGCAAAWPPLLTKGKPQASGAEASLIGVTKRKDGTEQVTYNGHPLYGFFEDKKPGDTKGNDVDAFGAQWYALMPNGEEPEDS